MPMAPHGGFVDIAVGPAHFSFTPVKPIPAGSVEERATADPPRQASIDWIAAYENRCIRMASSTPYSSCDRYQFSALRRGSDCWPRRARYVEPKANKGRCW